MVGHMTYLSAEALRDKFGRRLQFADDIRYTITEPEFEIESYLDHQADRSSSVSTPILTCTRHAH